ncbi:MAG: YIP1 family protein [Patescibacteria group bacterium]|nr:YIP1 family protein [Patescibacteria group bacterium]
MLISLSLSLLRLFARFSVNTYGVFHKPYETWRRLVQESDLGQIAIWGFLLWAYLSVAVVVKNGLATGALFLTFNLNRLFNITVVSFMAVTLLFWLAGTWCHGRGSLKEVAASWVFSYLPTLIWFFSTTILYLILPPPRTQSFLGQIFTLVFLAFSLSLLFWKIILYYLTMRFALRMNLWQILRASLVIVPALTCYFLLLNRLGFYKIPLA